MTDQDVIWQRLGMHEPVEPSGDQTPEQAANLAAASFVYVCALEGVEPPSEDAVREQIAAR